MARVHTTNGFTTNPEVRFERTDVDLGTVVRFGLALMLMIVVVIFFLVGYFRMLRKTDQALKDTRLPTAAVDADRLPPEPRLEAVEDLEAHNVRLRPPRAQEYLAPQDASLAAGDPKQGVLPIETAIDNLAGKLPSRKGPNSAPPMNFTTRLPSKAASGRVTTGGQ